MRSLSTDLSAGAQTSYAQLQDMAQSVELAKFSSLSGSFHRRTIRGKQYVYFAFRDADGKGRSAYVGPENDRVRKLIDEFHAAHVTDRQVALAQRARACEALGCASVVGKHFRIIQRLAQYGFFRAGGVLIGAHAFTALANMLGVRWVSSERTMDVDFAHAGRNISVALPADLQISVHDALTSLEMGLLPIREFSGRTGAQYRNPADPELRIDFLTSSVGSDDPIEMPGLGIALQPLRFMEFSLEGTAQGVVFSNAGACVVNLPDPARFAVHKLIVFGERPISERTKSIKDVEQAAALIEWHLDEGRAEEFQAAWQDALGRGPGWRRRAEQGQRALVKRHPSLADAFR